MAKRESTKGQTTSTDNTMAKRYQRSNQNPFIEEEQTTQWPKENVQKDKQRYKTYISMSRVLPGRRQIVKVKVEKKQNEYFNVCVHKNVYIH
jgi:hypothetical protein